MKLFIVVLLSGIFLFSCKKETETDPEVEPVPAAISFTTDIQPIFQQSCGTGNSCHGSVHSVDGKVYETHAGASAVPSSTTMGAIKHESGFSNMPQGGSKLTDTKIAIIQAWIDGGKLND